MNDPETCLWLVERASNNPEPDSYADTITIGACGEPVRETIHQVGGVTVHLRDPRGLCVHHAYAMSLPDDVFEAISESYDGRAFS